MKLLHAGGHMNNRKVYIAALFFFLATIHLSLAQEIRYGAISGKVVDASDKYKKGVSNAKVKVNNTDTNVETIRTSDVQGYYSVWDLLPGHYEITVEKENYKKTIHKNIRVEGGIHKLDIRLEPGKSTDVVVIDLKPENIIWGNY
jgi:hypothetical protein